MAWYNKRTKKIEGAQPSTLVYYHEKRHEWQDKHKLLDVASTLYYFSAGLTLWFLIMYPAYPVFAIYPIGIHFALMVALEVDAWVYAFTHAMFKA